MSERITADNLDEVIKRNEVIEEQMKQSASLIWSKYNPIEKMKEPKAPKLPPNPIEKAEEHFMSDLNPVYGLLKNSMDGMQPFYSARSLPIIDPAIFNNSNSSVFESISIRDNSIFAECNQLPHKDDTEFDGIYIVPARKGKFKVSVSLMCSEYIEPKVHDIEFEIV